MAKKTDMVTRRVIDSREYDVYKNDNGNLEKITSIVVKGKPNKTDIANELKVDSIVLVETKVNKKVYGVPIDDFMAIAVEVEKEQEKEQE